jgi:hypothetical protein
VVEFQIPDDAKISDIIAKLDSPIEYVRRVLGNMGSCRKKHGTAFVRIGTTGRGVVPHYRVGPEFSLEVFNDNDVLAAQFVAFLGRSHKQLPWGFGELNGDNWSLGRMNYDEVQILLGSLRKS